MPSMEELLNKYLLNKVHTLHLKNMGDVKSLADSDYDNTNLKIKCITESGSKVISDLNDSFNPQDSD